MIQQYRLFLIFVSLHWWVSCAQPGPGAPPPVLDRLVPVVTDLQLAEALTNEVPIIFKDSLRQVFYQRILADHQLDQPAFDSLMWIVRAEPEWIDSLYLRVENTLTEREAQEKFGTQYADDEIIEGIEDDITE